MYTWANAAGEHSDSENGAHNERLSRPQDQCRHDTTLLTGVRFGAQDDAIGLLSPVAKDGHYDDTYDQHNDPNDGKRGYATATSAARRTPPVKSDRSYFATGKNM